MLHSSLNWEQVFQKGFYGFEKCIWKSFQKSWRLSWKQLLLGALKSNQLPKLSPKLSSKMPSLPALFAGRYKSVLTEGSCTRQDDRILLWSSTNFSAHANAPGKWSRPWQYFADVLPTHPSPTGFKGFRWGYHTPGRSPALFYQMRSFFEI